MYGAKLRPAALLDNSFQRHTVTRATPGGNNNVWIESSHRIRIGGFARLSNELASRCIHQLCYPRLRANQRFAPLLAVDTRTLARRRVAVFHAGDLHLHL